MLTVFAVPHSSSPTSEPEPLSNAGAQSWNKVRAWFSRERGRAGKILQLALIGAARAASSASTNVETPTPQTHRHAMTNAVWESQPEMESRLRETQRLTTLEWVGVRRAEEYQKMVDGALPPLPSETTEMGSRTHVVKRKPVPSLDTFDDGGVLEPHLHLVKSAGLQDETSHDVNCTWRRGTFPGSPHDFPDSASDQEEEEEDSDQDSYDQEDMQSDSDSEDETLDRGQVVAEMCSKWGWTLQDVLETLEQPGLEGRRKCSREKGVLRA